MKLHTPWNRENQYQEYLSRYTWMHSRDRKVRVRWVIFPDCVILPWGIDGLRVESKFYLLLHLMTWTCSVLVSINCGDNIALNLQIYWMCRYVHDPSRCTCANRIRQRAASVNTVSPDRYWYPVNHRFGKLLCTSTVGIGWWCGDFRMALYQDDRNIHISMHRIVCLFSDPSQIDLSIL